MFTNMYIKTKYEYGKMGKISLVSDKTQDIIHLFIHQHEECHAESNQKNWEHT